MAEKEKQVEQPPKPDVGKQSDKPGSVVHSIVTVIAALLVVALVFFGVFYFAVKNNINGLADNLGPKLVNIPILRLALPKPVDPDDPKNLTEKEILSKYEEYRAKVKELNQSLDKANETIRSLTAEMDSQAEAEKTLAENRAILENIQAERAKLEEEKKALSQLIAKGDTQGFQQYFEQVDKETAEVIYREILQQKASKENNAELAKAFAAMEPEKAANLLAEMFKKDSESAMGIFEGLKPNAAALILEKMDVNVAADIYTKLISRNN